MSESPVPAKPAFEKDGIFVKTTRLTINLITHILMCFTVFVCIVYACSSKVMNWFHWHIILCVLGYQFFMSQGTLVTSSYNSWSLHFSRRHKKYLHVAFQIIGTVLVIAGSFVIVCRKSTHFQTMHGSLGIATLIVSFLSILNGVSANYAYKFTRSHVVCIKYIHYISGIFTLLLSAASLSSGLNGRAFRVWASNDDAVAALVFISWLFTLFVAFDFWISTGNRLRNLL